MPSTLYSPSSSFLSIGLVLVSAYTTDQGDELEARSGYFNRHVIDDSILCCDRLRVALVIVLALPGNTLQGLLAQLLTAVLAATTHKAHKVSRASSSTFAVYAHLSSGHGNGRRSRAMHALWCSLVPRMIRSYPGRSSRRWQMAWLLSCTSELDVFVYDWLSMLTVFL